MVTAPTARGEAHYEACASQRLVALVDIDDHNRYGAVKWLEDRKFPKAQEFTDFRKMYETMAQAGRRRLHRHSRPLPRRAPR